MQKNTLLLIILGAFLALVSACSGSVEDAPAQAAHDWYVAVNTMEVLEADGLVCQTKREDFRRDLETGSTFLIFGQLLLGGNVDIELDVSEVKFTTVEQDSGRAIVEAKGEMRGAVGGQIHSEYVDEQWLMVKENDEWKWCGKAETYTENTTPAGAQPTQIAEVEPQAIESGETSTEANPEFEGEEVYPESELTTPAVESYESPTLVSVHLPGDGVLVGTLLEDDPSVYTGEIVTIFQRDMPVGYVYYFGWEGDYSITDEGAIAEDINIGVKGLADPANPNSEQMENSISFLADELVPGASKSVQAGALIFTATIEDVELVTQDDTQYYRMGSVVSTVDVSSTVPGQLEFTKNDPQYTFSVYELKELGSEGGWTEYSAKVAYANRSTSMLPEKRGGEAYVITDTRIPYDATLQQQATDPDNTYTSYFYTEAPVAPGIRVRGKYTAAWDAYIEPALQFKIPSTMKPEYFVIDDYMYPLHVYDNLSYPFTENTPVQPSMLPVEYTIPGRLHVSLSSPIVANDIIQIPLTVESLNQVGDEELAISGHYAVNGHGFFVPGGHPDSIGDCNPGSRDVGLGEYDPLTIGPLQTVESEICIRIPIYGDTALVIMGDIEGIFVIPPGSEETNPSSDHGDGTTSSVNDEQFKEKALENIRGINSITATGTGQQLIDSSIVSFTVELEKTADGREHKIGHFETGIDFESITADGAHCFRYDKEDWDCSDSSVTSITSVYEPIIMGRTPSSLWELVEHSSKIEIHDGKECLLYRTEAVLRQEGADDYQSVNEICIDTESYLPVYTYGSTYLLVDGLPSDELPHAVQELDSFEFNNEVKIELPET